MGMGSERRYSLVRDPLMREHWAIANPPSKQNSFNIMTEGEGNNVGPYVHQNE